MEIKDYSNLAFNEAKAKGWYDEPKELGTRLMLINSELVEAMGADRKGEYSNRSKLDLINMMKEDDVIYKEMFEKLVKDTFQDEIADTFIRLFDLCGYMEIDIELFIIAKMKYNKLRKYKHGKKY